ncbi:hypothetical protein F383_37827 [Gossypium arboreum]|uniref:Uncharacterized protein n=1 Tax=Gossypium arboreum TaxID=29729 RepID=A0A0B0MCL7_GOSAR|nr:hypothetical protein F383_37827 [Gossypium arboreum]
MGRCSKRTWLVNPSHPTPAMVSGLGCYR